MMTPLVGTRTILDAVTARSIAVGTDPALGRLILGTLDAVYAAGRAAAVAAPAALPLPPVDLTEVQALALGGALWQRAGIRRVYLDGWPALVGLHVRYDQSGGVTAATLHGAKISYVRAGQLLQAQVYVAGGRIYVQELPDRERDFAAAIRVALIAAGQKLERL